jgi:heme oxygenase (biliverdin-IX-beta and delta-forming)
MERLRQKLKQATHAEHCRLEARLDLTCPDLPLSAYVRYLERSFQYYARVERLLHGRADLRALGIDSTRRAKTPWLEDDLRYFRKWPSAYAAPDTPLRASSGLAEALGCSYVLEGATLGGAYLYARLRARWGVEHGKGASFLYGYGTDTARMWKAFVSVLDAVSLSGPDEDACITAARTTFRTIEDWHAQEDFASTGP